MPRTANDYFGKRFSRPLWAIALSLSFSLANSAQEQAFDYHLEETPAVSWNRLPLFDARAMAAGGVSQLASPAFAAVFNPALIPNGPPRVGAGFAAMRFQAFQYWGVNQGVIHEQSPLTADALLPASLGGALSLGQWRLAGGYYLSGVPRFPDFAQRLTYEYDQYWEYHGSFSGQEQTMYAASAWQPAAWLTLGIRLAYVSGKRWLETSDIDSSYFNINNQWILKNVFLKHKENHRYSHWVPALGTLVHLTSSWDLDLSLEYPLSGRVQRSLEQSFDNPNDGVHLSILREYRDARKTPANLRCGTAYTFKLGSCSGVEKKISLAAEARGTFWSTYRYEFFGETLPRDFRDTVETALGMEYTTAGSARAFSINLGVHCDPQPSRTAATTLWAWSGGVGARLGRLSSNIGLVFYSGATAGISQRHVLLAAAIAYEFKGE
jgi:hypothetical protein